MYKSANTRLTNIINKKNYEIRNMRLRLKKIKLSIDYLLEHPYLVDCSYKGRK